MTEIAAPTPSQLNDEELVRRICAGEPALFEEVMRRYNQRLYRVARAVLKDDPDVEDAMQHAYIQAFLHLGQFAGRSQLSTWLTRITINEALRRRRRRQPPGDPIENDEAVMSQADTTMPDPEHVAYAGELRSLLEASIDALPEMYRLVFVCREVEGLSTAETGDLLGLGDEAVKTRLHRARAMLRHELFDRAGAAATGAFVFHRPRCDVMVSAVFAELRRLGHL